MSRDGSARHRREAAVQRISNAWRAIAAAGTSRSDGFVSGATDADDVALIKALLADRCAWFSDTGVHALEDAFAAWNGSRAAFAFSSGREALSACIAALELNTGDEVIIPGYTCVVVPNAFAFAGVQVRCADIELDTYGPDIAAVEQAIRPSTRAIVLHHLYGLVCRDYEAIVTLARNRGLAVIEDCAHATGARYKGVRVGTLGDVAFYSCEHSKVVNAGQGGLAVTNNPAIAAKLCICWQAAVVPDGAWIERLLITLLTDYYRRTSRTRWLALKTAGFVRGRRALASITADEICGIKPTYYGRRMPGAVAAVAAHQLGKLDRINAVRRQTAARWDAWCDATGHAKPLVLPDSEPVYLRYPVLVDARWKSDPEETAKQLGIPVGIWFASNYHPARSSFRECPRANEAVARCINFPTLIA